LNTLKTNNFPFDNQQNQLLEQLLDSLDTSRLYWLHGYIQGLIQGKQEEEPMLKSSIQELSANSGTVEISSDAKPPITVLFGTHTGNSRKIAALLHQKLQGAGHTSRVTDIADYKPRDLKSEKLLIIIISTHGEGQPPLAAEEFYDFIHSSRCPLLPGLSFAVLALGDKSYFNFCKTGADVDLRLEQQRATRLIPRFECDLDYAAPSESWMNSILESLPAANAGVQVTRMMPDKQTGIPLPARANPIEASVLTRIKLNGRNSEKKTYHLELQLPSEKMIFEPGDSVGIIPANDKILVKDMFQLLKADSEMPVVFEGSSGSLGSILTHEVELTKLTRENLEKYCQIAGNRELNQITQDKNQMSTLLYGSTWADLLNLFPCSIRAEEFLSIARPIQPRLYSIASSARAYPGELHITVNQLNYNLHGRMHRGICSNYLAELPEAGEKVRIFFETNDVFRLPAGDTDMIMIGPGTGVAPFRAFMQEREDSGATGKNWLFFGDWRFTNDFLYQTEWQAWHKKSLLDRIDLAFSRDQQHKIYVQHRMVEKSRDVYDWIENGAKIYVCGDMQNMAADVNKALVDIVCKEGGITLEKAKEYVKTLRREKRYLEDVY
jgi:sulfite reductase (NADPH) flavoprotein alpha-component